MSRLAKLTLLVSLILVLPIFSFCQEGNPSRYALNIGLGVEKVGIPFRKMIDFPMHSSYHIGIERKWSESGQKNSFQSLNIIAFTNTSAGSGYMLHSAYGLRLNVYKPLYVSPSIGVGLVHLFRPKESFDLVDGVYNLHKDRGHLFAMPTVELKLGYQVNRIGLFVAYQVGAQLGYGDDVPVLPRTFLRLGGRYEL